MLNQHLRFYWQSLAEEVSPGEVFTHSTDSKRQFRSFKERLWKWKGKPAVYRFVAVDSNKKQKCAYPGETADLRGRLSTHLTTNSKPEYCNLRAKFESERRAGLAVLFEILHFEPFELEIDSDGTLGKIVLSEDKLSDKRVRRALEALAILSLPYDCKVLSLHRRASQEI